jgi:hypothetical protein
MPEITWTNCADAMPTDDAGVIVKSWTGQILRLTRYGMGYGITIHGAESYHWTSYTPEKWEELSK